MYKTYKGWKLNSDLEGNKRTLNPNSMREEQNELHVYIINSGNALS